MVGRNGRAYAFGLAALPLAASTAHGLNQADVDGGQRYYKQYCASCHGADAKGNGPMAAALQKPPTDLTQLAKKNGGNFPYGEVHDILEGQAGIAAHGSNDMPAWGDEAFTSGELSREVGGAASIYARRGRAMMLLEYLRSIQAK